MELLARKESSPEAATGTVRWRSHTESRTTDNLAWTYEKPSGDLAPLQDHIAFYWNAVDAWYEENEEAFVHPRDPYDRVDTVHGSRHRLVEVNVQWIA